MPAPKPKPKQKNSLVGIPYSGKGTVPRHLLIDGLTPKQNKFVELKAKGISGRKAIMEAYGVTDPNIANVMAIENLRKPTVRQAIDKAFETLSITPLEAIRPIREALDDGELDMRLKGSDRALKLMGAYQPDNNSNTNVFNFNLNSDKKFIDADD